jgi:hypothetical protein
MLKIEKLFQLFLVFQVFKEREKMSGKYYVIELTPCNYNDDYYKKTLYFRTKNDARKVCNFIDELGEIESNRVMNPMKDWSATDAFCSKYDREMFDTLYDRYGHYGGYNAVLKKEYIDKNYEPPLVDENSD